MVTNRRVFRNGVAPCVVGVFVGLFSASALGGDIIQYIQCGENAEFRKVYSLAELTVEGASRAGTKGCMRVLVPDVPSIQVTDSVKIYTHIVTAFIPESYHDAKYDIKGAPEASKYMTILSPGGNVWVPTSSKVESLIVLDPNEGSTGLHRVVDASFSITEDESTLTLQSALEGQPIPIDLAMIREKLSQTDAAVANCFVSVPWNECYSLAAPWWSDLTADASLAYENFKVRYHDLYNFEDEDKYKGRGISVPSPAERLTKNYVMQ